MDDDVLETTSNEEYRIVADGVVTEAASEENVEVSAAGDGRTRANFGDAAVGEDAIAEKESRIAALTAQVEAKQKARRFDELEEEERLLEEELLALSIEPRASSRGKELSSTVSRPSADAAIAKKGIDSNVTLDDLRRMKELASKAGTRVDELTGVLQHSSDSSEDEEREESRRRRSHRKGMRSGKKLHLSSRVVVQARWPQAYISRSASGILEPKYEQLTMPEFCAGYAKIMGLPGLDSVEREARIQHFQQLMHLACYYEWVAVLCFHATCLAGIESGELTWDQSFSHLESISLRNRLLNPPAASATKLVAKSDGLGRVLYCADYNAGSCSYSDDHLGEYPPSSGKQVLLSHVCAPCLRKGRKLARHRKGDAGCSNA
jgi:hypothetical protein